MADVQNAIYRAGLRSSPVDAELMRERYLDSAHRIACTVVEQNGRIVGFQSLIRAWPGTPYGVTEGWGSSAPISVLMRDDVVWGVACSA